MWKNPGIPHIAAEVGRASDVCYI